MAVLVIPTRTDLDNYAEDVDLDGITYRLAFAWNYRDGAWFVSISDTTDTPIASGLKVVCNTNILAAVANPNKPQGMLVALDTSGAGDDPGLEDLGARVTLLYQEPAA